MTANQINTEKSQGSKALKIGSVCKITYVINYYVRNILGVLTPEMVDSGAYTESYLALLASIYMVLYAAGQLINGVIGDIIKPKYMVSMGLTVTAAGLFIFSFINYSVAGMIAFGIVGFGLSMMRGPLVKVISENTLPKYARLCCVFLSFSSFAGPLLAGLAAMVMKWHTVFVVSGIVSLATAIISFVILTMFEKAGMVKPIEKNVQGEKKKIDILAILRLPNFATYIIVAMVVEISAISLNFWMPTFFGDSLGLSKTAANSAFSVISLLRACMPFVSLYIFKLLKERDLLILKIFFSAAAALLFLVFLIDVPVVRLVLFTLSLMCCSVSSSTLWSIYIPNLGKSGKVSSANGVIDCIGYIGAGIFNVAVVPIMDAFGWGGTILSWCCIMLLGVASTSFATTKKEKNVIRQKINLICKILPK